VSLLPDPASDPTAERAVLRKVTLRLVPYLMLCYFFAMLDRSNIGVASLQMNARIGLSSAAYGLGGSLFFIAYFLFEVPSNLALERYGARRWLARIMISWGVACVALALTRGPLSFYVLRFLLGAAEAGFFPGVVLYSTYWYPAKYRARIITAYSIANALASFVGSPVSAALLQADGFLGIQGWQWVFIAEGLPTVLLGFGCLWLLTDKPENAHWLSIPERSLLAGRLAADEGSGAPKISVWKMLQNPYVWGLTLACSGASATLASLGVWQPQLIKSFGVTSFQSGVINAVPYGVSTLLMMLWSQSSDRSGERRWHTALPLLTIAAGFAAILFTTGSLLITVVLLTLIMVAYTSFKGPFWAFSSEILSPGMAAAAFAAINGTSNLGSAGIIWLVGVLQARTHSLAVAMTPLILLSVLGAATVLLMHRQKPKGLSMEFAR
jgi:ACS family tartrate transporter-like MFS transporter